MHISTDIGDTFTDFVIFDRGMIKMFRVPSTLQKPAHFEHEGAAIIEGKDSTTVVLPDMSFSVDAYGDIVICR
jgi:N-methylhydantoinase A/oxoprolinase/acetone carboxylase beta subunit